MDTVSTGPDHAHDVVELEDRLEQGPGRDAHQHDAVTQPFGDPHPAPGADVAQQRPEGGQHVDGALVAFELRQRREARHVDEGEAAMDPHRRCCHVAAPQPNPGGSLGPDGGGRARPPTMAPWRRRGDSSRARWRSSAAAPRTSAAPPPAAGRGRRRRGRRRRGAPRARRRWPRSRGGRRPRRRGALRRARRGVGRRLRRARRRRVRGRRCIDHNAAWSHPRLDTDAVGVDLGVWERAIERSRRGAHCSWRAPPSRP